LDEDSKNGSSEDLDDDPTEDRGREMPESDYEDESDDWDIEDNTAPDPAFDETMSDLDANVAERSLDLDAAADSGESAWGTRLRPCLTMLDKIHKQKVRAGQAPAWPFADYLEFEFVKWMVDHDISQGARDKLIKLPIVSYG
jgi:hypothetical protein